MQPGFCTWAVETRCRLVPRQHTQAMFASSVCLAVAAIVHASSSAAVLMPFHSMRSIPGYYCPANSSERQYPCRRVICAGLVCRLLRCRSLHRVLVAARDTIALLGQLRQRCALLARLGLPPGLTSSACSGQCRCAVVALAAR